MYPAIIMALNICFTTLVPPENTSISDDECNVVEWDDTAEDGSIIRYRHRFIKVQYREGILPRLVRTLINERNAIKKQLKNEKDLVTQTVLDKRQYSTKVAANSIFGMLGAKNGKLPLIEGAVCITAKGRELIRFSNDFLRTKYGATIVYGDTDSTIFTLPQVTSGAEAVEWGKKLEKEISALIPDPLYLEFEKAGRRFSLKKKKYAFWLVDEKGDLRHLTEDKDALLTM